MWSKTPPSSDGFYRMRNIDKLTVAEKRDGMWHWIDTDGTAGDAWLIKNGWEFGDEVLFDDEPAPTKQDVDAKRRERELFERCFLAAMQGDWASPFDFSIDTVETRARLYKRAADAAVKVLTEATSDA